MLVLGCNGRMADDDTSGADSPDSGELCEGAALEFHGVCFRAYSVAAMGYEHPLDLDGQPGHELVGLDDAKVSVHRFEGGGFVLVGEAALPGEASSTADVLAGEFDDVPGLDLIVAEEGVWAALYHLDGAGAPTLAWQQTFVPENSYNNALDDRWRSAPMLTEGGDSSPTTTMAKSPRLRTRWQYGRCKARPG
ncbi:MAG: hypothetical protein HC927_02965 [Deltaproteobacteria bacterium]|nr:hypothetical protein [Deltaproteobacteria bacterium]